MEFGGCQTTTMNHINIGHSGLHLALSSLEPYLIHRETEFNPKRWAAGVAGTLNLKSQAVSIIFKGLGLGLTKPVAFGLAVWDKSRLLLWLHSAVTRLPRDRWKGILIGFI